VDKGNGTLKPEFLEKKLELVRKAMDELEVDMWITFSREGNEDPLAEDLRFDHLTWRSAAIIGRDGERTAIVGGLESELVEKRGMYHKVIGYGSEGVAPALREFVSKRRPKRIAVNTSCDIGAADGLSSGMERYLKTALRTYVKRLVSAEDIAIALRAKLIPEEIELLVKSIRECERIYGELEKEILPGRTDKQVHDAAQALMEERHLLPAWAADHCPSVVVGANPAGHLGYRGDEIRRGEMVKLDFGVRYEGYCSDIQRVYYVGGGAVPSEVKKTFDTARRANDVALAFLKPGVPGWKVDAAARRLVVREGFPEYKHALGHVLGRSTHEIGPLLGPRWPNRYGGQGEKKVEKDMVFTIEPSVEGKAGVCNLEQDVLVTESGYRALSKSQSEIITLG
jgi:Xaa-Pro aminopeptidase